MHTDTFTLLGVKVKVSVCMKQNQATPSLLVELESYGDASFTRCILYR